MIASARVIASLALVGYALSYRPLEGHPAPDHVLPAAVGLAGLLGLVGAVQLWPSLRRSPTVARAALGVDAAAAIALIWLFGFDPRDHLSAPAVLVVVEAALILGLPGGLAVWAAVTAGDAPRELWADQLSGVPATPAATALRATLGFGVALAAGSLARGLSGERRSRLAERREVDRRLQDLVQEVDAIVWESDADTWRFSFVSKRAEAILGYPVERWVTEPDFWVAHIHPDDRARAVQLRRTATVEGRDHEFEYRAMAADGRAIWLRDIVQVVKDAEGRPRKLRGLMVDVTGLKRAEETLRRQNEYLAALHETTLAVMNRLEVEDLLQAVVGRAGTLVGTCHGYLSLVDDGTGELEVQVGTGVFADWVRFRLRPGEGLAGKVLLSGEPLVVDDYDRWAGRSPACPPGIFRGAAGVPLTSGRQVVGVLGVAHLDEGRTFTDEDVAVLSAFARLASIALDNARLYTAAHQELAERKRAEEALRRAEATYRQLFNDVPVGLYRTTPAGDILDVNPAAATILGYPDRRSLLATNAATLYLRTDDRARWKELMEREGVVRNFEAEFRRPDGTVIWVRDSARAIRDESGRVLHYEGSLEDVTERRQAEEHLARAWQREREAAQRLRALDEMKNTFLAAVSHELRTPLTSILAAAVTLERREGRLDPEQRRTLLTGLASAARKLDRLLSDLLDLDRLRRGMIEPKRAPTDVGDLVQRVVREWNLLDDRPVTVETEPVVLEVDGAKVERIVENLLANAARHTLPETPVWVRVRAEQDGVLIAVEDAGPGVPEEARTIIFEPFRQGAGAPSRSRGVGIGLSLTARFAELHGGKAWVEEREGGGASFRVFLPGTTGEARPPTGTPTSDRAAS